MRRLLVPGRGVPNPEHWQRLWAADGCEWAPYPPGPPLLMDERVAALRAAVASSDEPAVLIAHSGGCLVTAVWAQQPTGPVTAALLVAPPALSPQWTPGPDDLPGEVEWRVPEARLPFRSIVVASRTDPHAPFEQSARYADQWGAELVDAGDAGHIDTSSGYGPFPLGERLLATLG